MFNKDKAKDGEDERAVAEAAVRAEVERLEALPLAQLAAELMLQGFGPNGYLADFAQRESYTSGGYVAIYGFAADPFQPLAEIVGGVGHKPVGEGLQLLEHLRMIRA